MTDLRTVGGELRAHVVAHLVTARTGAWTDRRAQRPVSSELAQREHAGLRDVRRQTAPAGVQHCHGAGARERDRHAVRGQHHRRDPGQIRRLPVRVRCRVAVGRRRLGVGQDRCGRGPGARRRSGCRADSGRAHGCA